jgi:hypothetical protein
VKGGIYEHLGLFVDWVNSEDYKSTLWFLPKWVSSVAYQIFQENLVDKVSLEPKFRPSNMHRPWVVQVLDYWYPHLLRSKIIDRVKFMDGLWWELQAYLLLDKFSHDHGLGWELHPQVEFDYAPDPDIAKMGIKAHVDLIISTFSGDSVCVELKALSDGLIKNFKDGYIQYDLFGYMTQISLYSVCTGMPVCFLIKNKSTSQVNIATISNKDIQKYVRDVNIGLHRVMELEFRDVKALISEPFFAPPKPKPEVKNGQETGNLLLPMSMRDTIWWPVFYEVVGTSKTGSPYVTMRDPDEIVYMLGKFNDAEN